MTEKEATGEQSNPATALLDRRDLARMEQAIKFRKEVADLSDKMQPKKRKNNKRKMKMFSEF